MNAKRSFSFLFGILTLTLSAGNCFDADDLVQIFNSGNALESSSDWEILPGYEKFNYEVDVANEFIQFSTSSNLTFWQYHKRKSSAYAIYGSISEMRFLNLYVDYPCANDLIEELFDEVESVDLANGKSVSPSQFDEPPFAMPSMRIEYEGLYFFVIQHNGGISQILVSNLKEYIQPVEEAAPSNVLAEHYNEIIEEDEESGSSENETTEESFNFTQVEHGPIAANCSETLSNEENSICLQNTITQTIIDEFRFPALAREAGIGGKVWISFIIEKDGSINYVSVVRSSGTPCIDLAALSALAQVPDFKRPARVGDRAVRMSYAIPINAQLN